MKKRKKERKKEKEKTEISLAPYVVQCFATLSWRTSFESSILNWDWGI